MKEYIVTEHPDFPYEEPKPQELIRCKDCKYSSPNRVYGCRLESFVNAYSSERMYNNDFCSRAERKED